MMVLPSGCGQHAIAAEFGAEVSVENHSRRPKPPRDQGDYGYR
jgi:hypothetical protein